MRPEIDLRLRDDEEGRVFGPGPRELLKRVSTTGSLSAAAAQMSMAYTKALRLVKTAERSFGFKLVERRIGGVGGGGSQLTSEAQELLARYDAWEREVQEVSGELFASAFAGVLGQPRLGCVVMASGEARRFGRQKLLEPVDGKPLLAYTLEALPTDVLDVVVSTRWPELADLARQMGFEVTLHEGPLQSQSMQDGLAALRSEGRRLPGCLFVQGDQPLVSEESLRELVRQMILHPRDIVRLAWQGSPSSPIGFPADLLDGLAAVEGDQGGSILLRQRPELKARVRLVEAQAEYELTDVDTPEELDQIKDLLPRERG